METNLINNLSNFVNYAYEWGNKAAHTALNQEMLEEAGIICHTALNQAFGAVQFASQMCVENGYPDLAKEVEDKWETVWSVWFTDLTNEVLGKGGGF